MALNIIDNFPNPNQFRSRLTALNEQVAPILDDFKKYYVFFNMNPENTEYQQMYQSIQGNMTRLNSDLFVLSNEVQSQTDEINTYLFELDESIREKRAENTRLKERLGIVEHENNAASEMISDYVTTYDMGYLRNWSLFLSILVAGTVISQVYKPATVV
jgi:hypothetical protein